MRMRKKIGMFMAMVVFLGCFSFTKVAFASTTDHGTDDMKDHGIAFVNAKTQPLIGAPVNRVWTFKATKTGTYTLVFTYARPWEKDSSDSKTVNYKITVVNKKPSTSGAVGLVEGKENTICKNQKFCIALEENLSTGYSWSYKTSSKTIKLINKTTAKNVGQPTHKIWTFVAKKSGTYKIVFTYARPWEKNSSNSKVVEYTVKVTDENTADEAIVALVQGKENTMKLGQKFSVSLEENASTGYSWDYHIEGNANSISK